MKRFIFGILMVLIVTLFSSCMMMMPDHMSGSMQEEHNHAHSNGKIDPVCGKQVIEGSSITYDYKGNTYYFESDQCLAVFKNDPGHFVQKQENENHKKAWAKAGMIGGAVAMTAMMVVMLTKVF